MFILKIGKTQNHMDDFTLRYSSLYLDSKTLIIYTHKNYNSILTILHQVKKYTKW